ncbi:MAG: hypothetical protein ABEJ24_01740 [Candidatus Magasanikbacteria bacterium]
MTGEEQEITQNMTFEIWCDSMKELEKYANEYNEEIKSFIATETEKDYKYNFIVIPGPQNICKMEINYMQDL